MKLLSKITLWVTLSLILSSCVKHSPTQTSIYWTTTEVPTSTSSLSSKDNLPPLFVILNSQDPAYINLQSEVFQYTLPDQPNPVTPNDILQQAQFMGAPGGHDSCDFYNLDKPGFFLDHDTVEWNIYPEVFSCGWRPGETVSAFITTPSNTISLISNETADDSGSVYLDNFYFESNVIPGTYILTEKGNSDTVNMSLSLVLPENPKVYYEDGKLILYNFSPNEHVRLLVYVDNSLWDVKDFSVDNRGQLLISLDRSVVEKDFVAVVGDLSGAIYITGDINAIYHSVGFTNGNQ